MRLPSSRPLTGRCFTARMLLIGMVALAAFPTFSIGDTPQLQLRAELQFISRGFLEDVGFIQSDLSNQLQLVPSVIDEGSVSSQIESIGNLGYGAVRTYETAYKSALTDARGEIAMGRAVQCPDG